MSSDEIGPLGNDQRTGGGGDLRLRASRDVCLSVSPCDIVFSGMRKFNQHSGWDGTKLCR